MSERLSYARIRPDAFRAMSAMQAYVDGCGLERDLLELVKLRASYINGCAFCVDMHTKDARAAGETEQRLFGVPVWRETPYFTERERAALEWTEAVAAVGQSQVPDHVYQSVREHFEAEELVGPDHGRHRHWRLEPAERRVPDTRRRLLAVRGAVEETVHSLRDYHQAT